MIVPDTNLLVYAHNELAPQREAAQRWLRGCLEGDEALGIPWIVATGFMRVTTDPRILGRPLSTGEAVDFVREWFEYPHVTPIEPGPDHLTHLGRMLTAVGRGGNIVPDAHIAALAVEHDAEVHSHDSDFGRFPGVRWRDPLRPAP